MAGDKYATALANTSIADAEGRMEEGRPSNERPWWVRATLWGLSTRRQAWAFVWFSMVLGVFCVGYGFGKRWWFLAGIGWLLAATGYLTAIRWVDRHGSWN